MLIGFLILMKISLYPLFLITNDYRLQVLIPIVGITKILGLSCKNGSGIMTLILVEKYG